MDEPIRDLDGLPDALAVLRAVRMEDDGVVGRVESTGSGRGCGAARSAESDVQSMLLRMTFMRPGSSGKKRPTVCKKNWRAYSEMTISVSPSKWNAP